MIAEECQSSRESTPPFSTSAISSVGLAFVRLRTLKPTSIVVQNCTLPDQTNGIFHSVPIPGFKLTLRVVKQLANSFIWIDDCGIHDNAHM